MKRFGLALAVGAVAVLAISGSASAGGPYDSVSGAIKRLSLSGANPERHFILSAHDGPQGPTGQYTATYGKGKAAVGYKGDVICVNVVGNDARVEIRITQSTHAPAVVGQYETLDVTDYGTPAGDDQMDSLSPGNFTAQPVGCEGNETEVVPTYSGNFTLNDGS
jgi:hypothetical protein